MNNNLCHIWLTCKNTEEASKIAKKLLNVRLIACAKQIPVVSDYRWKGKIEHEEEVLLMMESKLDLFDQIEAEVEKLHSYGTFVLETSPVSRVSVPAQQWWIKELK